MFSPHLRPFFLYFGGKFQNAPKYPRAECPTIIEPFAGAAGYSVRRYSGRKVILFDKSPIISGIWWYLIHTKEEEILRLPSKVEHIDLLPSTIPQEAKWLMGFWMNAASAVPCKQPSQWKRDYPKNSIGWNRAKLIVAKQLKYIRHWKVMESDYQEIPNIKGTWFIDPPYQTQGVHYPYNKIDFDHLSGWISNRNGQVIVCENDGATWLPFIPLKDCKAANKRQSGIRGTKEVIYHKSAERDGSLRRRLGE